MSQYGEYQDKAAKSGHRKPGPGGEAGSGGSSGCMVVATPTVALLVGSVLMWKVVANAPSSEALREVREHRMR